MLEFYRNKRVFVTGHTGFKGSWLCALLVRAGAAVTGYALPAGDPGLFRILGLGAEMRSVTGDIRDFAALWKAFADAAPEIVFHLAAQPIVREGYRDPLGTCHTNILGTVHVLECARRLGTVRSLVNVTTDKVYRSRGWPWGYRESDRLGGLDPYACSKSCAELVTESYRASYLDPAGTAVSTARAGNVIGGGDFAPDRILPDCIRAARRNEPVRLRRPDAVRPYQHVLEPLSAYLLLAERQYGDPSLAGSYNIGPAVGDCLTTGALADLFCQAWGNGARWEACGADGPREDGVLRLDCAQISAALGWHPRWNARQAVAATVEWTRAWLEGRDAAACTAEQAERYFTEKS